MDWERLVVPIAVVLTGLYGAFVIRKLSKWYYGSEEGSPHARPLPKEPRWPRPSGLRELPAILFGRSHKPSRGSETPDVLVNTERKSIGPSGTVENETVNRRLTGPSIRRSPSE